jgi:hypothetical protein
MFTGAAFSSLLQDWDVSSRHISARHPEANGTAERFIRTLRQLARKNSSTTTWAMTMPQLVTAYNHSKHTATSAAPIELFFKLPADLPVDSICIMFMQYHPDLLQEQPTIRALLNHLQNPHLGVPFGTFLVQILS